MVRIFRRFQPATGPGRGKDYFSGKLTILLLFCSNTFMTIAWYGHLRFRDRPLMLVIVVSWLIAFAEYCFRVPANRIGYGQFSGYQLKIIQEAIPLIVFAVFAYFYLREAPRWNYLLSFVCLMGAVMFAFWGRV
ncbi:MAG TPA: DMT family protein [Candidatus Binataceae bacterium]|jgi:hypothetical protein